MDWAKLKAHWDKWNVGGKIMLVSACVGVLALFFNWTVVAAAVSSYTYADGGRLDTDAATASGWREGAFLILCLWGYPLSMQLRNRRFDFIWGLSGPALAVVVMVLFWIKRTTAFQTEDTVVATGILEGAFLFLAASVGFLVGAFLYLKHGGQDPEVEERDVGKSLCDGYATKWAFFFESGKGFWRVKPPYWIGLSFGLASYVLALPLFTGVTAFFVVAAIVSRNHWKKSALRAVAETDVSVSSTGA